MIKDVISPKYVVVYCSKFGYGNVGWRLSEVDYFCYADSYTNAKSIVARWNNAYVGYDSGLSFMLKYENWLQKGGLIYDGLPYDEMRHL